MKIVEITATGDVAQFSHKLQTSQDPEIRRRIKKAIALMDVDIDDDDDDELQESKKHSLDVFLISNIGEKVLDDISDGDIILYNKKPVKIKKLLLNYLTKKATFDLANGKYAVLDIK